MFYIKLGMETFHGKFLLSSFIYLNKKFHGKFSLFSSTFSTGMANSLPLVLLFKLHDKFLGMSMLCKS